MADALHREMELRDYLRILQRRRRLLALVIGIVVGGALLGSVLQTPVYGAETEVGLRPGNTDSLFETANRDFTDPLRILQTEIRVITSQPVKEAVRQKLGYEAKISARPAGQANVIVLTAENTDRQRAVDTANAYADAYIASRKQQAVDDLRAAAREVEAKIADLQQQINAIPPRSRPPRRRPGSPSRPCASRSSSNRPCSRTSSTSWR